MANNKIFLGSVKSPNNLLKLINRAKSILKIQNLFEVNKFLKKAFATSFSALFVVYSVGFASLKQVGAMDGSDGSAKDARLKQNIDTDVPQESQQQVSDQSQALYMNDLLLVKQQRTEKFLQNLNNVWIMFRGKVEGS
ncbi:MAG: hypothetical protein LBJ32_02385 [Oscillospiraceae bacterium]|jgi:hypothetical protein|nr:hypothetical protein [Oscillospiraceae bacterium]